MLSSVAVMMRGPPGLPVTMKGLPSFATMVGVMLERGRFPGAMALEPRVSTRPKALGSKGRIEKSSISLFRMIPVPGTVIPEPNRRLMVWVIATAFPSASVTERWVVPPPPDGFPGPSTRIADSFLPQFQGVRRHQAVCMRARWRSA